MNEATTKAVKQDNGIFILVDDNGVMAVCPYATRVLTPVNESGLSINKGPGLAIQEKPCASNCPHFRVTKLAKYQGNGGPSLKAVVTCSNEEKVFNIETDKIIEP